MAKEDVEQARHQYWTGAAVEIKNMIMKDLMDCTKCIDYRLAQIYKLPDAKEQLEVMYEEYCKLGSRRAREEFSVSELNMRLMKGLLDVATPTWREHTYEKMSPIFV